MVVLSVSAMSEAPTAEILPSRRARLLLQSPIVLKDVRQRIVRPFRAGAPGSLSGRALDARK